jgi:hypothetical protein
VLLFINDLICIVCVLKKRNKGIGQLKKVLAYNVDVKNFYNIGPKFPKPKEWFIMKGLPTGTVDPLGSFQLKIVDCRKTETVGSILSLQAKPGLPDGLFSNQKSQFG